MMPKYFIVVTCFSFLLFKYTFSALDSFLFRLEISITLDFSSLNFVLLVLYIYIYISEFRVKGTPCLNVRPLCRNPISFRITRMLPHLTNSHRHRWSLSGPSNYLLKFTFNRLPTIPNGPLKGEAQVSGIFLLHLSLKASGK